MILEKKPPKPHPVSFEDSEFLRQRLVRASTAKHSSRTAALSIKTFSLRFKMPFLYQAFAVLPLGIFHHGISFA